MPLCNLPIISSVFSTLKMGKTEKDNVIVGWQSTTPNPRFMTPRPGLIACYTLLPHFVHLQTPLFSSTLFFTYFHGHSLFLKQLDDVSRSHPTGKETGSECLILRSSLPGLPGKSNSSSRPLWWELEV